jgi:hypothetical protein
VKLSASKEGTLRGPLAATPKPPTAEATHHVVIHLIELPIGVPRPEIVPPAAKHGSQCRDDLLYIFPALPLAGDLPNALPEFLPRPGAWPPLHKMPTGVALDAPPLADRASQEYEALLTAS